MNWFNVIRKERPHYNPDELTVALLEDFIRRYRREIIPKLKDKPPFEKERESLQWLHWLERGVKAMQTEEGNHQIFTNEYIIARLQDIMDDAGISESDSFKGLE